MRPRGRRLQACCVRPLWSLHRLLVTCGPGLKGRVGFRPTATGLEAAFLPFSFKEKGPPRALSWLPADTKDDTDGRKMKENRALATAAYKKEMMSGGELGARLGAGGAVGSAFLLLLWPLLVLHRPVFVNSDKKLRVTYFCLCHLWVLAKVIQHLIVSKAPGTSWSRLVYCWFIFGYILSKF